MFWTLQIISKFVKKVTVKKILETQPYKTWAKCTLGYTFDIKRVVFAHLISIIAWTFFSLIFFSIGILQDWWDPDTNKKFKEKAQCIIWQYGNYTSDQVSLNLNGINTQGENIADNGGIKQSFYVRFFLIDFWTFLSNIKAAIYGFFFYQDKSKIFKIVPEFL